MTNIMNVCSVFVMCQVSLMCPVCLMGRVCPASLMSSDINVLVSLEFSLKSNLMIQAKFPTRFIHHLQNVTVKTVKYDKHISRLKIPSLARDQKPFSGNFFSICLLMDWREIQTS